jgi:hypothetical protein
MYIGDEASSLLQLSIATLDDKDILIIKENYEEIMLRMIAMSIKIIIMTTTLLIK